MSSDSSSTPISIDPGKPVDTIPTYFWVWIEAVRLYWDSKRGSTPLSARVDFYPIIYRFYRPKAGSHKPNPSVYLSNLKKARMIRRFEGAGRDTFYVPETEITIRVRGKVVYTPGDLDALLAGDERFLPPVSRPVLGLDEENKVSPVVATTSKKKSHAKRTDRGHAQMVDQLHQAVFDGADPTDDPLWRSIPKGKARQLAQTTCGHERYYPYLYQIGRVKSGRGKDECLVIQPGAVEGKPAVTPPPQKAVDLTVLNQDALQTRLAELELPFDTTSLEGEIDALKTRINDIRARAVTLRAEADSLELQIEALVQEQTGLAAKVEQRILAKQQDQNLADLRWLIENKDRLARIQASLAQAKG